MSVADFAAGIGWARELPHSGIPIAVGAVVVLLVVALVLRGAARWLACGAFSAGVLIASVAVARMAGVSGTSPAAATYVPLAAGSVLACLAFGMWKRPAVTFVVVLLGFFVAFLFYPVSYVFSKSLFVDGHVSLAFFKAILADPVQRQAILRSVALAAASTLTTSLLALPLAFALVRYSFPGRGLLSGLILVPMIMPPFVGAIGMRQLLARFGSVNLLLMKAGIVDSPIDWLRGGGFWSVVIMETLHLYPIMFLNLAAALGNVDPEMEAAARVLGGRGFGLFRRITFPLMLPGYFAGAVIVFIWAFTDLGTPLVFDYRNVVAVQIFDKASEIGEDPVGYALVVTVILLTAAAFLASRAAFGRRRYELLSRGSVGVEERKPTWLALAGIYVFVLGLSLIALLPHLSVVLTSLRKTWFMTVLPSELTLDHYRTALSHKLTLGSIQKSVFYSGSSALLDIGLGIGIAYILTRKRIPGSSFIDAVSMLPLALPGVVIAFGYVACYSRTFLNPIENPVPLLIISYSVRRLPYMVRAAYAGFQQSSVTLEEASLSLGASPARTLRKITVPLTMSNLVAGGILAFAFAMLEVSDSLILAFKEQFYPITKAIYVLIGRLADGPFVASALGVWAMFLLALSLVGAGVFLGRKIGEIFRAS